MNYRELRDKMKLQRVEMTTVERKKAYFEGKPVDFQPYDFLGADGVFANYFGYTTSQLGDFNIQCEVIARRKKEFGVDGIDVGLGLRSLGSLLGSKLWFPENGIDYVSEFALNKYQDLEQIQKIAIESHPACLQMIEKAKRLKERFPGETLSTGVTGPITNAIGIRPVEKVMVDIIKRPQELRNLLELCVKDSLDWLALFESHFGSVGVSFSDPATSMNLISKRQFDLYSMPYLRKLVDGSKQIMGENPGAHICGKTRKIWGELKELDLSYFSVDNCEDLEETKEVLGSNMTIIGNVPPVSVMREGTIDDVIASCIDCLKKGADSPKGFILNTGCQLPLGTPRENVEAFLYAVREYGKDAQLGRLPRGLEEL